MKQRTRKKIQTRAVKTPLQSLEIQNQEAMQNLQVLMSRVMMQLEKTQQARVVQLAKAIRETLQMT